MSGQTLQPSLYAATEHDLFGYVTSFGCQLCTWKVEVVASSEDRRKDVLTSVKALTSHLYENHLNEIGRDLLAKAFWSKVTQSSTCWLWQGALQEPNGYGVVKLPGGPQIYAHRASWLVHFGAIPEGMFVCHKCDVKRCVRPDHLFLGTAQDNVTDMITKGRMRIVGTQNGQARLSVPDVIEIRRLASEGVDQFTLAGRFNVSQQHISRIIRKTKWRHIA